MDEKKRQMIDHLGRIFYRVAIFFMIISYFMAILFCVNILGVFAIFAAVMLFFAFMLFSTIVGLFTGLIFIEAFREFILDVGKMAISFFDPSSMDIIIGFITDLSRLYPIIATLSTIFIIGSIVFMCINGEYKLHMRKLIAISIMGAIYIISFILSLIMIINLNGGVL